MRLDGPAAAEVPLIPIGGLTLTFLALLGPAGLRGQDQVSPGPGGEAIAAEVIWRYDTGG